MGIADLFRPKWKHSDAEVRASAVRELSDEETLATIARSDSDAAVRRIAIKKLTDPTVLAAIARSDADESLRGIAAEKRTSQLLAATVSGGDEAACSAALAQLDDPRALAEAAKTAPFEAIRRAAVGKITDARALGDVARNAGEPTIRLEALRTVSDAAVLRSIAQGDASKEVALAAVEKIEEAEALETIAKKGKVKAVRARAQKKLDALRSAAEPSAGSLQQARLHQLCRTVESLASSSDWERAAQQIEAAQAEWREQGGEASEELAARFTRAANLFGERHAKHRAQRAEHAQHAQELRDALAARTALCERVESLSGDDALARLEEARARWQSLAAAPEAQRAALEQRFRRAAENVERGRRSSRHEADDERRPSRDDERRPSRDDERRPSRDDERRPSRDERPPQEAEPRLSPEAAQERAAAMGAEVDKLPEIQGLGNARRRLQELQEEARRLEGAGANVEELRGRLQTASATLEQHEQEVNARREQRKQENVARVEALCARLEGLVSSDSLKTIERQLKDAQVTLRKLGPLPSREKEEELKRRFSAVREQLTTRTHELRETEDWKRWANVPKQEELCARVEALLAGTDLKETAQKLRAAQGEWKQIGPVPKDKSEALWARFKQACDQVYARCQEYFTQLDGERSENLKKKQALCEQVEALADSTDWNPTAERIKQLQAEWKQTGPVARDQSDAIWKRFRGACDRFFDHRQDHLEQLSGERSENLTKKESLCGKVEALVEATDWEATAKVIKQLQADWKAIGPVPRAKSDAVWKRFRGACDRFFDRRQQQIDGERGGNLTKKEELCQRLEALIPASGGAAPGDPAQVAQVLAGARAEWHGVGPVPRDHADSIWERFSGACERVVELYPDAFRGSDLDPVANLKKKERLCEQVEALLPAEAKEAAPETGGAETVEEMAERLRQALAANAFADAFAETKPVIDPKEIVDTVQDLQAQWKTLGPVPGEAGQTVWERFRAACDRVFDRYRPAQRRGDEGRGARGARGERGKQPSDGRGERRGGEARAARGEEGEDEAGREENLKRKQEICGRAEALAAEPDPASHRDAARALQREWKSVGPVPRAKARALWNRFRRACGQVLGEERSSVASDGSEKPAEPAPQPELAPSVPAPAPTELPPEVTSAVATTSVAPDEPPAGGDPT